MIFSRIGGVQKQIYAEGLHFRIPWFQWPIIYDIRAKPRRISSPTGSKGMTMRKLPFILADGSGLAIFLAISQAILWKLWEKLGNYFSHLK